MLPGKSFIEALHARAFDPSKLVDRAALRSRFPEAHVVHLANHFEAGGRIECRACLVKKAVGSSTSRLAGGIQANSSLTDPDQETTDPSRKRDGRV
jgi:hypothetical protein